MPRHTAKFELRALCFSSLRLIRLIETSRLSALRYRPMSFEALAVRHIFERAAFSLQFLDRYFEIIYSFYIPPPFWCDRAIAASARSRSAAHRRDIGFENFRFHIVIGPQYLLLITPHIAFYLRTSLILRRTRYFSFNFIDAYYVVISLLINVSILCTISFLIFLGFDSALFMIGARQISPHRHLFKCPLI